MKLYNLYESVILEEINKGKKLLFEGISDDEIDNVIDDKRYVKIKYQDDEGKPPTDRYIQVYNRGATKAGNPAIRAYQAGGQSKTGVGAWKIFLINKIISWNPTDMKWHNPISDYDTSIPAYNQMGDKSMSVVNNKVDFNKFNRPRSDIRQRPMDYKPEPNNQGPDTPKPRPKLDITNNQGNNQNQNNVQKPRPKLDITNDDNDNENEI